MNPPHTRNSAGWGGVSGEGLTIGSEIVCVFSVTIQNSEFLSVSDVQLASAERAPALDKAFFRKAAWRYPAVIFKNGDTLRSCFSVQALCFCIVFLDHVKYLQIHATSATST